MIKTHLTYKDTLTTLCGLDAVKSSNTEWCPVYNEYNSVRPTCETCILMNFMDDNNTLRCDCVDEDRLDD